MSPNRTAHPPHTCDRQLTRAFAFLGKRWNGMLIISESVLSDRLSELTAAGLVLREVAEGPPVGVHYRLTPAGEALTPILHDLARWAHEHLPEPPPDSRVACS